jgi:hypothetical protein
MPTHLLHELPPTRRLIGDHSLPGSPIGREATAPAPPRPEAPTSTRRPEAPADPQPATSKVPASGASLPDPDNGKECPYKSAARPVLRRMSIVASILLFVAGGIVYLVAGLHTVGLIAMIVGALAIGLSLIQLIAITRGGRRPPTQPM